MSVQEATQTYDCKVPGCTEPAKRNRGSNAYLCATHIRERPQSRKPKTASQDGYQGKVRRSPAPRSASTVRRLGSRTPSSSSTRPARTGTGPSTRWISASSKAKVRVTGRVRLADGREGRIVSTQLEHYTDRGAEEDEDVADRRIGRRQQGAEAAPPDLQARTDDRGRLEGARPPGRRSSSWRSCWVGG